MAFSTYSCLYFSVLSGHKSRSRALLIYLVAIFDYTPGTI